ncbi:MAG: peptidylprolyl isomerase [Nitrosopumilus sp.]|nr:peptidylprolyl isomerase [Nitrosopumilus sp.]
MQKFLIIFIAAFVLIALPTQTFAQSDDKLVILETSQGKIVIEFFPEDAPIHVENFMNLTESEFYDGVLFHRIIPGFMIQGGDPNTKNIDNSTTWGQGNPGYSIDAEFNTIKHNRGILSMARSQSPDSGGSQFFIVHQNSNHLDQQYTVFGRIVTDESFETLDKIASVETTSTVPVDIDDAKIIKAITVSRSDVPDLLDLGEPERVGETIDPPTPSTTETGSQLFENEDLDVSFSAPEGWSLQTPPKTDENTPDIVAVGPQIGEINPVISLRIIEKDGKTFDDFIQEKNELLEEVVVQGNLQIISQEKSTIKGKEAYVTNAEGIFQSNNQSFNVKFKETTISGSDKFYTFAYSNGMDDFDNQVSKFDDSVDSFKILSEVNEGGGCLIATATFGSELAPQVQQLRELRDNTILSTKSGVAFMSGFNQFYYTFSPSIADFERENPIFKETVKLAITPMLTSLSILNHVNIDSEQEMLGYGISIMLMNIGMYFVAPAVLIYKFRK